MFDFIRCALMVGAWLAIGARLGRDWVAVGYGLGGAFVWLSIRPIYSGIASPKNCGLSAY